MITPKEFIFEWFNDIIKYFNNIDITINYKLKSTTNTHIIEILPTDFYVTNEEYLRAESEFESEFNRIYPDENILFISTNSLTKIGKPDCTFKRN